MITRRLRAAGLAVVLGGVLSLGMAASALAAEPPPNDGRAAQQPQQADQQCRGLGRLAPRCVAQGVGQSVSGALGGVGSAVSASIFQQLYDWVVGGATWLLRHLVSAIDSSTRPDLLGRWFGVGYRLMISLATLLVLPVLLIATIGAVVRQDWSGLTKSYFVYLPMAAIGTAMAIPLTDMGLDVTDWMSGLFLTGMRDDIQGFLDTSAAALTNTTPGQAAMSAGMPLFLAFLGAVVIALGAFAVWVELVLRSAGIYVAVFFLPLGFAALVWPHTRAWFGRLAKTLVALILSKFVIVAVLALAAAALTSVGVGGSGGGQAGGGASAAAAVELASASGGLPAVISGAALMLMAAFSPLVLFRVADVAGGEMATAFAGVTQGRTSPVRMPDSHSAARMYSRVMNGRPQAGAGIGGTGTTGGMAGVGATAGLAGGGMLAAGGRAAGVPGHVGRAGAQRLDGQAAAQAAAADGGGEVQAPKAARQPGSSPPSGPARTAAAGGGQPAAAPNPPAQGSATGAAPPQVTPTRPADLPYVPERLREPGRE